MDKISVVIPVYGCPAAIPPLIESLTTTLKQITENYEIILVNDDCPKNSWSQIETACRKNKHIIGVQLSRNFGQLRAITAGLDISDGDWVVVMDCDLQDRPEEILNLYKKAQEGYDIVFARRKVRQDKKLKVAISKCFYKVYSYATEREYDPAICNFSISRRNVVDAYCSMRECHRGFVMYLRWLGFKEAVIDVEHCERYEGTTSYTFKKHINLALELLTSQSDKLLRVVAGLGVMISAVSLLAVLVIFANYFIFQIRPGWTSIVASLYLLGGIIIASIGVVGIYVGNIFTEVKRRPLYVVRTILNGKEKKNA